jgi:hypothetical protein
MSYTLEFATENVIVQRVKGVQSLEDLAQSCKEIIAMIESTEKNCYLLLDVRHMSRGEGNVVSIREVTRELFTHPRLKKVVMYGANNEIVAKFLTSILANLFKLPMRAVATQEAAAALLLEHDPSLDGSLQYGLNQLTNV